MERTKRMLLPQLLVQSLVSGATQVSMPVKPQPILVACKERWLYDYSELYVGRCDYDDIFLVIEVLRHCPFPIGTQVWVPETWQYWEYWTTSRIAYKADGSVNNNAFGDPWNSPATMPSNFARLRYEVEDVKVERQGDDDFGTFVWAYTYTLRRLQHE